MIVTLRATCVAAECGWTCEIEAPSAQHKRLAAERRNRDIVMQTHTDTTGHPRFRVVDVTTSHRILSRSNQMTLGEDPDIDLKDLGKHQPAQEEPS